MLRISLFKVGLVAMLFFVLASNVLNYVAIATTVWAEDFASSLWSGCAGREKCFRENPPALIATGTALNCLSFVLIIVAQVALFSPRFKDSFALWFVIGSELTTLLSLLFSSIGWFFVFFPQYQIRSFNLGWSFWLMTPSFGTSIIAAVIGAAILGCTCVTNTKNNQLKESNRGPVYMSNVPQGNIFFPQPINPNDQQVLRL